MYKRDTISLGKRISIYVIAILIALVLCAAVIFGLVHMNPIDVYKAIWTDTYDTSINCYIPTDSWKTVGDCKVKRAASRYNKDTGEIHIVYYIKAK